MPTAIAATTGRVLSNVSMTPAKPLSTWISGLPSRLAFGMRALSNRITAVSEALMPSLSSRRSTVTPGCSRGTMNDLMAARPNDLSSVAHTTIWVARDPAVTKIFSPLITYSSPSSLAVVDTAAESDPKPGSVIAIAAQTFLPSSSSCSSVATPEMASLPSPWRGTESINATSPQLISITLSTADMLPPLWLASLGSSPTRKASAPANAKAFASEMPSKRVASVSSSTGYSCSRRSYLREIGRSISAAPWCAFSMTACSLRGSSKLIVMARLPILKLDDDDTLGDADGPQIAVPAFDRVFLRVTVAAEQLDAVQPDLHALVGAEALGQCGFAGERQPLVGASRPPPRDQAQPVEFDRDVGAHECHRLPVGDRLTECVTLLDIWHHVVEHRMSGSDRKRRPAQS